MKDIKDIRKDINNIDAQMADLFTRRMDLAKEVSEYKKERGLPIYDKEREDQVIQNNLKYIANEEIKDSYVDFITSTMRISRDYQRRLLQGMKVAYSGTKGAYAYITSKRLFPDAELISYPNFASAYNAVNNSEVDVCVLPFENSYAGDVGVVNDLMFQGNLYINDVYELEIVHNLIVKKGTKLEDIKVVWSHPQALAQCNNFITKHNLLTKEFQNTALAAKALSESNEDGVAVIASEEVLEIYTNLELIKPSINDARNNTTKFGVFAKTMREPSKSKMGDHFIIMFTVANEAGALATTLNIIGSHGFNMRALRSRPMKELIWNYYFFVEMDGDITSTDGKEMIKELSTVCDCLKVVGTYYTPVRK